MILLLNTEKIYSELYMKLEKCEKYGCSTQAVRKGRKCSFLRVVKNTDKFQRFFSQKKLSFNLLIIFLVTQSHFERQKITRKKIDAFLLADKNQDWSTID